MLVGLKKSLRLCPAHVVEVGVDATALYHAPAVEIGFAVANQVDRFLLQACRFVNPGIREQNYVKTRLYENRL